MAAIEAAIEPGGKVIGLQADAELAMAAASCAAVTALQAGARAPQFALADASGCTVTLERLLDRGAVVLHFFRGGWCADGQRHLRDFAASGAQVAALGASAVAIAPGALPSPRRAAPAVLELSDTGLQVARAYGLAYSLPASLRQRYQRLGYRPPAADDPHGWLVPVPALYVLDRDGIIVMAAVELDYRKRFEPTQMLGALQAISPIKRERSA